MDNRFLPIRSKRDQNLFEARMAIRDGDRAKEQRLLQIAIKSWGDQAIVWQPVQHPPHRMS